MSITFVTTITPRLPTRRGRPAGPLPTGLSADQIERIRRRADKMARSNGAGFGVILFAKILGALSEYGLARLSMREILALAKEVAEMPDELVVGVACFIGAHPPATDFRGMQEAIRYGQIGGVRGLVSLHKHIRDRARKNAFNRAKRFKLMSAPDPSRPTLQPLSERKKRRAELALRETEAEIAAAGEALARVYRARHRSELKPWLDFIEVCQAIRDSGYQLVSHHRKTVLEIAAKMSSPASPSSTENRAGEPSLSTVTA